MPPAAISSVAQITTSGRSVQAKNVTITIKNAIETAIGLDAESASREVEGHASAVRGAYLHVPFCFHKCHYCDFYSIVDNRDRQAAFTDRLSAEIEAAGEYFNQPVETIFAGGGTPTLLEVHHWERLLPVIQRRLGPASGGEFTVEANPETVTAELAGVLVSGGVNRISIGCQTFNPRHLKTLERWHDPANVHRSVEILRSAGIGNFNLDLIFAIPGQTLDEWLADLEEALSVEPSHISCYSLMYEPNTPLTVKMKAGAIERVDPDIEAAMYEATIDRLAVAGFEHYEISNWARKEAPSSRRCRHNMLYWTNANWWPLGPSASGHVNGLRWKNVPRLGEYLDHGPLPPITDVERIDEDGRIGEEFMLGLRIIDGIEVDLVERLLSRGERADSRRCALAHYEDAGLLWRTGDRLHLTRRGLLVADTVLADLI